MKIVYWSGSGNTEKMASLIAQGINDGGKNAEIINVSDANSNIFDNEEIIVLGCPAMGDEVLEECEFNPFIESISDKVSGKKVALFGSFDWGDGQWMRDWKDRMEVLGCQLINDGLIIQEALSEDCNECVELGKKLSSI